MSSTRAATRTASFTDRRDAGHQLAERLTALAAEDPIVVALPRGGVPVAKEIADALGAPLEVLAVRSLALPTTLSTGSARSRRTAPA